MKVKVQKRGKHQSQSAPMPHQQSDINLSQNAAGV